MYIKQLTLKIPFYKFMYITWLNEHKIPENNQLNNFHNLNEKFSTLPIKKITFNPGDDSNSQWPEPKKTFN